MARSKKALVSASGNKVDSKKSPTQQATTNIKLNENPDAPSFYSNYIELRASNEEAVLTFARRNYANPEKQADVLHRTYISIPHYVRLTTLLLRQLEKMVEMGIMPEQVLKDVLNEHGSKKA